MSDATPKFKVFVGKTPIGTTQAIPFNNIASVHIGPTETTVRLKRCSTRNSNLALTVADGERLISMMQENME